MYTKDQLVLAIIQGVPSVKQITAIDTISDSTAVRFIWKKKKFRVSTSAFVESSYGGVLAIDEDAQRMYKRIVPILHKTIP